MNNSDLESSCRCLLCAPALNDGKQQQALAVHNEWEKILKFILQEAGVEVSLSAWFAVFQLRREFSSCSLIQFQFN